MLRRHAARLAVALVCVLAPAVERPQAAAGPVFQFQNSFWVNLHQFLRGEARRAVTRGSPRMGTGLLADAERIAWSRALGAYGDLAARDPLTDPTLVAIINALARAGDSQPVPPRGIDPVHAEALTSAAPIYRRYLWLRHRDRNDTYITLARSELRRRGTKLAAEVASRDHVAWPAQPVLVDVVSEAAPDGAYTTAGPAGTSGHVIVASFVASESRTASDAIADALFRQMADYLKRRSR
jgi:hypothetical protein